jgi:hypothetical protein
LTSVSKKTARSRSDKTIVSCFAARAEARGMTLDDLVNALLKQDIERMEQAE